MYDDLKAIKCINRTPEGSNTVTNKLILWAGSAKLLETAR